MENATASTDARRKADDLIWEGNVRLLEHEQRALVQPNFDRLSCAFARLVSMGSATTFEVRGVRHEVAYFTSFYLSSLTRGIPHVLRAQAWPRITRFDDRWWWLVASVVPRFRRFDADTRLVDTSLRRIFDEARHYASTPASFRACRAINERDDDTINRAPAHTRTRIVILVAPSTSASSRHHR